MTHAQLFENATQHVAALARDRGITSALAAAVTAAVIFPSESPASVLEKASRTNGTAAWAQTNAELDAMAHHIAERHTRWG